jgi:hypothetical protein
MSKLAQITFNVLPTHKAAIEQIARAEGEPVSVVLRQLIREAARERGLWPADDRQAQAGSEAREVQVR